MSVQECARLETLGGLEGDERWDYRREVVRDLRLTIDRDDKDLKALSEKLGGNPLALRVILLRLGEGKTARELLDELDSDFTGAAGDDGTEQILKAFGVLKSGIAPELSPALQVIGLHEHFADVDLVAGILGNIAGLTDLDSPEAQSLRDRVARCFDILENAGLCIWEGGTLYQLRPALRGCLSRMCPPTENMKRWFVTYLTYMEDSARNDDASRLALFAYDEANLFHAKTLAEELDMREEDLQLTWGLALYANDRSRDALQEAYVEELAEKAHRFGDFDMERRAYGILSALATDPERERFLLQKAADMSNGADGLSARTYFALAENAKIRGDLSAAEEHYKRELAIRERNNNPNALTIYSLLADLAQQQGEMEDRRRV